jgi:hypothetical protein
MLSYMRKYLAVLGVAAFLVTGCSVQKASNQTGQLATNTAAAASASIVPTVSPAPAPRPAPDAASVAELLKSKIASITAVTVVTEALDTNKLLGRPGQYTSAAWIADSGGTVGGTGIDGGAVVEVFATAADAQARSEYILATLKKLGVAYGTEWHHLQGTTLLRVSGQLSPSVNGEFTAAFGS